MRKKRSRKSTAPKSKTTKANAVPAAASEPSGTSPQPMTSHIAAHALAFSAKALDGHAPLDYPLIPPYLPAQATMPSDVNAVLLNKLYDVNSYRKELIRRGSMDGEDTTKIDNAYGEAVNEADELLAKIDSISNGTAPRFPTPQDINKLTAAMKAMEQAVRDSKVTGSLITYGTALIKVIPANSI